MTARCCTPVIIPLMNGIEYTKGCVESLRAQDVPVKIILIDNGSSDGTQAWAKGQEAEGDLDYVRFMFPSVSASWNWGLRSFFMHYEAVLVLNNDTRLRPDTVRWLLADGGGFVTAVGVTEREKIAPPYHTPDPAARRPHPDFSCFLIRKWVYDRVGPFDEKFEGAFCEDWDYHVRLHRAGVESYCIDLPFWHFGSQTIKNSERNQADAIGRQAERNRNYFFQKWGFRGATAEYYSQFSAENFGIDQVAR